MKKYAAVALRASLVCYKTMRKQQNRSRFNARQMQTFFLAHTIGY